MKHLNTAVIFAGGKSSRMGKDKALLPFGGYPTLTQFQYTKVKELFEHVYISSKENKFDFSCNVIKDVYQESSPLVGLISIFETLECQDIFVLSVDAPFVDEEIITAMIQEKCKENADAIVAVSPHGIEPLCAIYSKSILPLMKTHYTQKNHRLSDLLHTAKTHFIKFESQEIFLNLNRPEDYQKALDRFFDS